MAEQAVADIGLIGLAVMGENLALNIADHGFKVAVYNRTTEVMKKFIARENPPGGLVGCETLKEFVAAIKKPRKIIILVKAGPAGRCGGEGADRRGRREGRHRRRLRQLALDRHDPPRARVRRASASSSARASPAASWARASARRMMPGGDPESWKHLKPIWEAVAAKVDAKTGKPMEDYAGRQADHRRRAVHRVHRPERRRATT